MADSDAEAAVDIETVVDDRADADAGIPADQVSETHFLTFDY